VAWLPLGVLAWSAACSSPPPIPVERTIDVTGFEYAYQAPDSVDAGPTLVRFRNTGKVSHELIFLTLRPGTTVRDLAEAQKRDESFRPLVEGGSAVLFGEPNDDSSIPLFVEFEPGRDYVLWCDFTDGDGKPEHSRLGMFKAIHVRGGGAMPGTPRAPNEVVIDAADYTFTLPDTLAPGPTDFRMRNTGQQRHEAALSRLIPGATAAFLLAEEHKGNNVDSLFDGEDALLTSYPGDDNRIAMRVDLLPGRTYILACHFRDAPDKPSHLTLGMFKEIVVRQEAARR
jgi:hypothetical protein